MDGMARLWRRLHTIFLVLFTVAALNYPFRGDVHIAPEAFEQVLGRFESSDLSDL
jgi:hypothetical protein